MPIYEYEHLAGGCEWGNVFEVTQSISEPAFTNCPCCRAPVRKLISKTNINCPKTNTELKDLGFTKLVRRDDGVYENMTARNGDSRYMVQGRPETVPKIAKTSRD